MGLVNLASSQRQQGDLDAAEASYREALAIMGAALDKTDPRLGVVSVGLARVAHARGDPGQAIATLDTVLSGWETADHPPEDHELAAARLALAQALADTRREPGRAAALAEQARAYYAGRNRDPRVREADAVLRAVRWPARSRRSRPPDAVSPTGPV
jgi:hypothetical protein